MPGARDPDQTIMTVSLSKKLLGIVDDHRPVNRAQFIRDAIAEKLERMGIKVPGAMTSAPDRVKKRFSQTEVHKLNCSLNDAAASEPTPERREVKYSKPAAKRGKRKPKGL